MKVTFIYHSAFLVELERCSLLFDWYGGDLPKIDRTKPLYVFASHHHGDHYSQYHADDHQNRYDCKTSRHLELPVQGCDERIYELCQYGRYHKRCKHGKYVLGPQEHLPALQ